MSGNLDRRIERLEQEVARSEQVVVWRELGETAEQAVEAWFPTGVPAGVDVLVIGRMEANA